MYSTLLHKRNTTPDAVPSPSDLSAGEIAINVADGKLFTKDTNEIVQTFTCVKLQPYTLDTELSSVNFQYGNNTVTDIFASVLNGTDNDVSGAGSTVVNGSDNDIAANYGFIGNGSNNKISADGDFGAILGGENNNLNHQNSFIIGSNITSHLSGFTYVNNLSVTDFLYGDGRYLQNVPTQTVLARVFNAESTTLVRGNVVYSFGAQGDVMSVKLASSDTEQTSSKTLGVVNDTIPPGEIGYVTISGSLDKLHLGPPFQEGDALWLGLSGQFTRVKQQAPNHGVYLGVVERANEGNGIAYIKIQNGYELNEIHDVLITTPLSGQILRRNSSGLWTNTNDGAKWDSVYTTVRTTSSYSGVGLYLPLSGGDLTGEITTTSIISSTNDIYANNQKVIVGESSDVTPVYKIRAMTQIEYNALGVYDDNTIYFIKQ